MPGVLNGPKRNARVKFKFFIARQIWLNGVRCRHLGRKPQAVGVGPRLFPRWLPCHPLFTVYHRFIYTVPSISTNCCYYPLRTRRERAKH